MPKYFKNLTDPEFFNFEGNLVNQATGSAVMWGIPPAVITDLTAARTAYEPLYTAIINKMTRTPQQVQMHQEARDEYEDDIEQFANEYIINNSAISNAAVEALGFNRRSDTQGARPVITTLVVGALEALGGSKVRVSCRTSSDSSRTSVHPDADGVEVKYAVGTAPATVNDCPNKEVFSKSRFIITLDAADAGKKIYVYLRWRNNSSPEKNGPWGNKLETVVG